MIDYRAVGRCLSEMRRYFRITREELAARLNVPPQEAARWENGEALPQVEQLLSLSELFGVTVNDILRGDAGAVKLHKVSALPGEKRRNRSIAVIGAGRWGCFIAWYLNRIGHRVTLVGREGSKRFEALQNTRRNEYVTLPESIGFSCDEKTVLDAEIIILAIPSQQLQSLVERLAAMGLTGKIITLCMKGLEVSTGRRLTQVVSDGLDHSNRTAVWVGPGHVEEFVRGVPNCMVIDSSSEETKQELVHAFSSELIRFYFGRDLIGSEVGAAAKNVIGIAAGILDGLDLASLKGALMSRGTSEISRLIVAMGGEAASAYGLCHLGDYEATLFSPHSHNRAFGEAVARGLPYHSLAEGYATVKALRNLGKSYGVELPICEAVYQMVYEKQDPAAILDRLFARRLKDEF